MRKSFSGSTKILFLMVMNSSKRQKLSGGTLHKTKSSTCTSLYISKRKKYFITTSMEIGQILAIVVVKQLLCIKICIWIGG